MSTPTTRTRQYSLRSGLSLGSYNLYNGGAPLIDKVQYTYTDNGIESVTSTSNPGPPYKTGGSFFVKRKLITRRSGPGGSIDLGNPIYGPRLSSPRVIPADYPLEVPLSSVALSSIDFDQSDLESFGATGINKFKPGKPLASAGQFLLELRDLPKIPLNLFERAKKFRSVDGVIKSIMGNSSGGTQAEQAKSFARNASRTLSGEYLNQVFGWFPFVNDLQQMFKLQMEIDKRLLQIRQQNGKWIKRKGNLLYEKTTTDPVWSGGLPPVQPDNFGVNAFSGEGYGTETTVIFEKRYWFSGEFRYWINPATIHSDEWTKKTTRALFGLSPTPSLLYQVMPWSWLIDWFSNVGDVIDNLSNPALDNLVMRNTFVMGHTKRTTKYKVVYNRYHSDALTGFTDLGAAQCSSEVLEELKARIVASPFGFGIQLPDLSGRQLSILAALGLSKRW